MAYNSLERLGTYLYRVTFSSIVADNGIDSSIPGGCSSYVINGRLYRNLDWDYSDLSTFHVKCSNFEGLAFSSGLTDTTLNNELIEQLPYRVVDGVNKNGIIVSTHVLFNDWHWEGRGNIPLYKVPYLILSRIKTLDNFQAQIADILGNLYASPTLVASDYLLHFLVTDGVHTYCIMPPENASGAYVVQNISELPKLANFRWVNSAIVNRADLQNRPTGVERWNAMPTALENLRFTRAYESPSRLSEFIGLRSTTKGSSDAVLKEIYDVAHELYESRTRDGSTWQTMHSVVYGSGGMEHLWIQEDWTKDYISADDTSEAESSAYIDLEYYSRFSGSNIARSEFSRLADIASDVIYGICRVKPSEYNVVSDEFKKAVAYEVELLYEQGGVDAILGMSEAALEGSSESLGDYSITSANGAQRVITTPEGIPISPMSIMLLRRMGLMSKWAYAPYRGGARNGN